VQAALSSVAGVDSASVDFESKSATVVCSGACDRAALIAALEKQGFGGTVR
jgi:copper chaperone CopZ